MTGIYSKKKTEIYAGNLGVTEAIEGKINRLLFLSCVLGLPLDRLHRPDLMWHMSSLSLSNACTAKGCGRGPPGEESPAEHGTSVVFGDLSY